MRIFKGNGGLKRSFFFAFFLALFSFANPAHALICMVDSTCYVIKDSCGYCWAPSSGLICKGTLAQNSGCIGCLSIPEASSGTTSCSGGTAAAVKCSYNGASYNENDKVDGFPKTLMPFGSSCTSVSSICKSGGKWSVTVYPNCAVQKPKNCSLNGVSANHGSMGSGFTSSTVLSGQSCKPISLKCYDGSFGGSIFAKCAELPPTDNCSFNGIDNYAPGEYKELSYSSLTVPAGQKCKKETRICSPSGEWNKPIIADCTSLPDSVVLCSFNGKDDYPIGVSPNVAYDTATVPAGETCVKKSRTCKSDGTMVGVWIDGPMIADCTVDAPPNLGGTPTPTPLTPSVPCTSPGKMTWNATLKKLEGCDGDFWRDLTPGGGPTPDCPSGSAGKVSLMGPGAGGGGSKDVYYCNGSNWIRLQGDDIGTCPSAAQGKIIYDKSFKYFKYCDGSGRWRKMGI